MHILASLIGLQNGLYLINEKYVPVISGRCIKLDKLDQE